MPYSLAIHGTCNDLACSGARPAFFSMGLILEEGLPIDELERILDSTAQAADQAGVEIVTGDTKVAPRGALDKIFINTSGIGRIETPYRLGPEKIVAGDEIVVSGPIGNHGMAVMLSRAEFSFEFDIVSDSASVWPMVERLLELGPGLKFMRDPTRGGLSATLNEICAATHLGVVVEETAVPIDESTAAAAEILGIDPMQAANEGKIVAVVGKGKGREAVDILKAEGLADHAALIGEVTTGKPPRVVMKTRIGGSRIIAPPSGELLPRIC
ncbi:MAG: hydrogenase expression/formation protein HypE [Pseudomonadota bacterium]